MEKNLPACPVETTLMLISDRWKVLIIRELLDGTKRFGEIKKSVGNVLEFKKEYQRFHPTQKPVNLLKYLIKIYSNEGDTVLDNCMGSGSTGVACVSTKRNFIGMELKENYFEIAKRRIEEKQETIQ